MATSADPAAIASLARKLYVEELLKGLPALAARVNTGARSLADKPAERATLQRRRDLAEGLHKRANLWLKAMNDGVRALPTQAGQPTRPVELPPVGSTMSLVDNDTIEREILTSRLALAMMDRASWEFTELRSRVAGLERRGELDTHDMLRTHVLARVVLDAWRAAGLNAADWREAQPLLHHEFAQLVEAAYRQTSAWLSAQPLGQPVDLRQMIRRPDEGHPTGYAAPAGSGLAPPSGAWQAARAPEAPPPAGAAAVGQAQGHPGGYPGGHSGNYPGNYPGNYAGPHPGMHAGGQAGMDAAGQAHWAEVARGYAPTQYAAYPGGTQPRGVPAAGSRGNPGGAGRSGSGYSPSMYPPSAYPNSVYPESDASGFRSSQGPGVASGAAQAWGHDGVGDETRLMTRAAPLLRGSDHAHAVLARLNRLVGRHLPGFADTAYARPVSEALSSAINHAQQSLRRRFGSAASASAQPASATPAAPAGPGLGAAPGQGPGAAPPLADAPLREDAATIFLGMREDGPPPSTHTLLEGLRQQQQELKRAANTPSERATIEIVAMMFQSILTEEHIPAAIRVWFARLQMPVLRVAVGEPDFFATLDHPARRLIDRMGACVMGLDAAGSGSGVGSALEKEIKRVVQVVEAYPDTGRRVFQTVLVEFERFLEHYFRNENEATRRGVTLAQQVEQRETLAIQYTIELRRMLNEVPVQEGVRQFLFQVWADVLATSAVRYGPQSDETRAMKRAAADLIWSASAKVTREERADVIRRLPPLLKRLREGMASANMSVERQDERITELNNALAAAFTAKAASIPTERLQELKRRLESLEELLPAADAIEIDESLVLDLSGHESAELEVVAEGGSMPTAPMVAWARELMVGSWFKLEYRGRTEAVQLAWTGMHRQLSLFVTTAGRCVLFQQPRLAAFLQAGLLLPAQEESLTVKATRNALAKLDADPSRLMA